MYDFLSMVLKYEPPNKEKRPAIISYSAQIIEMYTTDYLMK